MINRMSLIVGASMVTAFATASILSTEDAEARMRGWGCGPTNPSTWLGCINGDAGCRIGTFEWSNQLHGLYCNVDSMAASNCCVDEPIE